MRAKTALLIAFTVAFTLPNQGQCGFITQTLGDEDFFGFGAGVGTIGVDPIPAIDVDNRTASDPLFTDHDIRPSIGGTDDQNDVGWSHDFSASLPFGTVQAVTVELALAGIQDALGSPDSRNDRIFFEGIEVIGALDTVDQGAFGTGLFSFSLTAPQIASFATDGILDIFFDGFRAESTGGLESYFIDYSRVTVETDDTGAVVPEPTSLAAFGIGTLAMSGIGLARRRKRRSR